MLQFFSLFSKPLKDFQESYCQLINFKYVYTNIYGISTEISLTSSLEFTQAHKPENFFPGW